MVLLTREQRRSERVNLFLGKKTEKVFDGATDITAEQANNTFHGTSIRAFPKGV